MRVAPISLGLGALAVGAASACLSRPPLLAAGAAVVAVAACASARRRRRLVLGAAAVVAGNLIGAVQVAALSRDPLRARIGHPFSGQVLVTDGWHGGRSAHATGSIEGVPVLIRLPASLARPPRGSILAVTGTLAAPRRPWAGFDERAWLARSGIHEVLRVRTARTVGHRGGIAGLIDSVRAAALRAFAEAGKGDQEAVVAAISLGDDSTLSAVGRDDFRRSGLAHLLAVSGGNVALLVLAVVVIVWLVGGTRAQAHLLAIVVICGYVALVGPAPSVTRAGVAGCLGSLAWLGSRRADAWHALLAGAALLLCLNPLSIGDPGFQLSFAAVTAILVGAHPLQRVLEGYPFPAGLRLPAAVTAVCTLVTAPIGLYQFGTLNLIASLPANLAAVPALAPVLWVGLLAAIVAPLDQATAVVIAHVADPPAAYLLLVARLGARLDRATTPFEVPVAAALLVAAVACAFQVLRRLRA